MSKYLEEGEKKKVLAILGWVVAYFGFGKSLFVRKKIASFWFVANGLVAGFFSGRSSLFLVCVMACSRG